tara:strand:- start:62 stop:739 length:678 start_codon:yes stop_codon:yes gene_type:complete
MKIYFGGCSWTEAGNLKKQKYEQRFSRLVSDHFGAEEHNFALSGGSNDRIIRKLLVEHNIEEYDLAVIQMTFPARTEYYGGVPKTPEIFMSGWIRINPSYPFGHMIWKMKNNILEEDVLNRRGVGKNRVWNDPKNAREFDQHRKFWSDYYRTVTTNEFFGNKEKIQKLTVENHCEVKKVPLVICTQNPHTKEKYDLQLNEIVKEKDAEGHRIIADHIIRIAEERL